MVTFTDILERTHTGPVCKEKDWNVKVVPSKAKEVLQEYDIKCDKDYLICTDNNLADDVFEAGFRLAVELGVLCIDTERIIKISEEELKNVINVAPSELIYGEGADRVIVRNRRPEDRNPAIANAGPYGTLVSEDLWIPVHQSFAQYRVVDILCVGFLSTVYSNEIRPGTPYEFFGGILEAKLSKEALRRAGRPGMPMGGVSTDLTGHGFFGGWTFGGLTKADLPFISMPSELKTTYWLLTNAAYTHEFKGQLFSYHHPIIGGYVGGIEAAAIMRVACELLMVAVYQAKFVGSQCLDIRYFGNCGREAVWANSVAAQAVSRNSHLLVMGQDNPVSGPETEMILLEGAVAAINETVGGSSAVVGIRPAQYPNHTSGLEGKWLGELVRAAAGLKRNEANDIVKKLIPRYEKRLRQPPIGKAFPECFDLKTLQPKKEWLEVYNKVKNELIDLGLSKLSV